MQESPAQTVAAAAAVETSAARPKQRRGFAVMDPDTLRAVCSQGGRTAHAHGRAHRFNPEEASRAGKRAVHRSPQTEPTWPRSVSAAARPRRATERGKLPDGKPSPRRPRSFDTDRLTPSASTLPCVSRNRTSQPWLDCRTIHADRHLTHIPAAVRSPYVLHEPVVGP